MRFIFNASENHSKEVSEEWAESQKTNNMKESKEEPNQVGEKPDFFDTAKKYATNVSADPDEETPDWIITDFEAGANHVWDTYVTPLQARIKGLEQERDAALSERDEILNMADMRIKELESSQSSPDFQSIVDEFMEGFAFQVPYDGSNDFYNKELLNLRPYIERELKIIWDKYIQKLPSIDQNEIPQDIKKALRNRWELVTQSSPVVETPNQVGEKAEPNLYGQLLAIRDCLIRDDTDEAYHILCTMADPDLSNLNHWAAWELKSKLTPIEPLKEEWISVKERLPEPQHDCLFTNVNVKGFKTPPVRSGYYANDRFYSWGGNLEGLKATHWMPLPSPPKV